MHSPSARTAPAPIRPVDHDATPEWDTSMHSDFCGTCGWPCTKGVDGAWSHDAKNLTLWTDKRLASAKG